MTSRTQQMTDGRRVPPGVIAAALLLGLATQPARAGDPAPGMLHMVATDAGALPAQSGPTLLTVTRADGSQVTLDRGMLESLPQVEFQTTTIWTQGLQAFSGVPIQGLVSALGLEGATMTMTAANGYEVRVPLGPETMDGGLLALHLNGHPMRLRDKGPLWMVYPYDSDPRYRTEVIYSNSIWQLDRIRFSR